MNNIIEKSIKKSSRSHALSDLGEQRFETFIKLILIANEDELTDAERCYLCLFVFDMLSIEEANEALCHEPYYVDSEIHLAWNSPIGRNQRLILSTITIQTLSKTTWADVRKCTKEVLTRAYSSFASGRDVIKCFQKDRMTWIALNFSGPIAEHLAGTIPMTALPDSAYFRLVSHLALDQNDDVEEPLDGDGILMDSFDGFLNPLLEDRNPVIVDAIVHACRKRQGLSNHMAKKQMLNEVTIILKGGEKAGPITSLLIGWVVSLISQGTATTSSLAQASITSYVNTVAREIFNEFKGKRLSEYLPEDYKESYENIILNVSAGRQHIAVSALGSFHQYLVDWIDAPWISRIYGTQFNEMIPAANILWQHEITLIVDWLDRSVTDTRLVMFWRLAILLMTSCRLRISEFIKLRLEDVIEYPYVTEIKISRGKTQAATRTLQVHDHLTIEAIRELYQKRIKESALRKDFLLGDPVNPQNIYELGRFYIGLNRLLKTVTGDNRVYSHTLSHTVISNLLEPIIDGHQHGVVNPFNQFASDVGHYSIVTSCYNYMHLYPSGVRRSIERAVRHIKITSKVAADWSNQSEVAIRKNISRRNLNKQDFYWEAILNYRPQLELRRIESLCQVKTPSPPEFLFKKKETDYLIVLGILSDIAAGFGVDVISLRHGCRASEVKLVITSAGHVISRNRIDNETGISQEAVIERIQKLDQFGISFARTSQPKFSWLLEYLKRTRLEIKEEMIAVSEAWLRLFDRRSGYIALDENLDTLNLVNFLKEARLEIIYLNLFKAKINEDSSKERKRQNFINMTFLSTYSLMPAVYEVTQRSGRPDWYLGITHNRAISSQMPSPASASIAGLNALMFSLAVFLEILENESTSDIVQS